MTEQLAHPFDRDDGLPWVPWESTPSPYRALAGCRERVSLDAWYEAPADRLVVTVTRYDESLRAYAPCWAQVATVDAGPFFRAKDVTALMATWAEQVMAMVEGAQPSQ